MQYLVKFDVGQPDDMTHEELFKIWYSEAEAALHAKEEGVIIDLWKVAGERTVYVLCDLADNHALDAAIESLPILQKLGGSTQLKVIPVYPYEQWADEMKKICAGYGAT